MKDVKKAWKGKKASTHPCVYWKALRCLELQRSQVAVLVSTVSLTKQTMNSLWLSYAVDRAFYLASWFCSHAVGLLVNAQGNNTAVTDVRRGLAFRASFFCFILVALALMSKSKITILMLSKRGMFLHFWVLSFASSWLRWHKLLLILKV